MINVELNPKSETSWTALHVIIGVALTVGGAGCDSTDAPTSGATSSGGGGAAQGATGSSVTASATAGATTGSSSGAGGAGVVLSGSGFGAKTSAPPFFWQSFTSNDTPAALGYASDQLDFGSNSYGSALLVDPSGGRQSGAGSITLSMPFMDAGDRDFFPHLAVHTSNQTGEAMSATDLYLAYWLRFVRATGSHSGAIQLKGPRSGSGAMGTNFYSDLFNYIPNMWFVGDGTLTSVFQEVRSVAGDVSSGEHFNAVAGGTWETGDWNFVEYRMHLNTPGVADGYLRVTLNGHDATAGWDPTGHPSYDQVRVLEAGDTQRFNFSFLTPGVDAPGMATSGTYEVSFAEHYLDTTFARVVVSDAATYASSTTWALQRCTTWSDTSISIEAPNWGGLTSGATAYFHVFDATGALVASLPETVP